MLNEVRQLQKEKYCMNHLYEVLKSSQIIKSLSDCQGDRGGENFDLLFNRHKVLVLQHGNSYGELMMVMVTQPCVYLIPLKCKLKDG